jgi:hypothetical protein
VRDCLHALLRQPRSRETGGLTHDVCAIEGAVPLLHAVPL